jgi:crossover junction endodeoxyribonuclease RusA
MTAAAGSIAIELGWPAKALSPNAREHFMTVSRFKRAAKDTAFWATRAAMGVAKFPHDGESKIPFVITAYPPDKHDRDDDNLISQTKAARDGIALALGVNDKFFATRVQWGEPVHDGKLVITIGGGE